MFSSSIFVFFCHPISLFEQISVFVLVLVLSHYLYAHHLTLVVQHALEAFEIPTSYFIYQLLQDGDHLKWSPFWSTSWSGCTLHKRGPGNRSHQRLIRVFAIILCVLVSNNCVISKLGTETSSFHDESDGSNSDNHRSSNRSDSFLPRSWTLLCL